MGALELVVDERHRHRLRVDELVGDAMKDEIDTEIDSLECSLLQKIVARPRIDSAHAELRAAHTQN